MVDYSFTIAMPYTCYLCDRRVFKVFGQQAVLDYLFYLRVSGKSISPLSKMLSIEVSASAELFSNE